MSIVELPEELKQNKQLAEKAVRIAPAIKKTHYSLSSFQKRLYVVYQLDPSSISYNMFTTVNISRGISIEILESAFRRLIQRHELWRTSFVEIDGIPYQQVHDQVDFSIEWLDDSLPVQQHIKNFCRPFHLQTAPLLRVGMVKQENDHLLLIDQHHIISDGASQQILLGELMALLKGSDLPPLPIQYKDYTEWQTTGQYLSLKKKQAAFWRKEFEEEIIPLMLPYDHERPQVKSTEGASLKFSLAEQRTRQLVKLCQRENTTVFTAVFAIYHLFLSKMSGQRDIVVGLPSSGRNAKELEGIVGPFVNMLAVRYCSQSQHNFTTLLHEVKEKLLLARENQDYQYDELVAELAVDRNTSRNPLFDVVLAFEDNNSRKYRTANELPLRYFDHQLRVANFDLQLRVDYVNDKLTFHFDYSSRLFKKDTIARFINYFEVLINGVLDFPEKKIGQLQILPEAEKQDILGRFNDTAASFRITPIAQWFEELVRSHPDRVAIVQDGLQLTYASLHERSSRLAAHLRQLGIGRNNLVCLVAGHSVNLVVGMLAIIKTGAAYVPIDLTTPVERARRIINDCNAGIVLYEGEPLADLPHCLQLDITNESYYSLLPESLQAPCNINDPVYVIFTSGSTGQPKGVVISQYNLINFVHTQHATFGPASEFRSTQICNTGFDATDLEVWPCLLGGGSLHIPSPEVKTNIHELKKYFHQHAITFSFLPTPIGEQMLTLEWGDQKTSLKHLLIGGDKFTYMIRRSYPFKIFNVYGPTEDTVLATWTELNQYAADGEIIGVPFQNKKAYILNQDLSLMPVDCAGEIALSGAGVALGYLNRPELTNERFVANPYEPQTVLYKTGDKGKWRSDGAIRFIGRKDNQVKINGNRVEPDEIGKTIARFPGIEEAIVVAREIQGEKYLCAYYISAAVIDEPALRHFLQSELPAYMIPAWLIKLAAFPLTPNGKIDRNRLPMPQDVTSTSYVSPRNDTDKAIIKLWAEILRIDEARIGIQHNFFLLGGHSMKAIELCSHIHRTFNRVVKLSEIFRFPTVAALSDHLVKLQYSDYRVITRAPSKAYYELSFAQKRIFLLSHFEEASVAYNMPQVWNANAPLDMNRLQNAITAMINRHSILRTSFQMLEGRPVQVIAADIQFKIETFTCADEEVEGIIGRFFRPFDLLNPPLFRFGYIETTGGRFILLSDKHHIISDGISESLFFKELIALYDGQSLPPVPLQYVDFAEWQHGTEYKALIAEQEKFWLSQFDGDIPVLDILTDDIYPAVRTYEGGAVDFDLDEKERQALYRLAVDNNTTLFSVLLAAINILLSKLSAQEDIVVGTLTSGRNHADLKEIPGIFINTLAIRSYPEGEKKCRRFIQEVKENVVRCFDNQDYPFEDLLERLSLPRDPARNPLFNAFFVLQNLDPIDGRPADIDISAQQVDRGIALFDLSFQVIEKKDQLHFSIGYYKRIFKKETIESFASQLRQVIRNMISNPDGLIGEMEILPPGEKHKILYLFNDTEAALPASTLVAAFEKQVRETPFHIAVSYANEFCTYRQLDEMANRCANSLIAQGGAPEAYVGILLNSGIDMIVSILAAWKAGMAYIPLDTTYPEERILYILHNSGAGMLITNTAFVSDTLRDRFTGKLLFINDTQALNAHSSGRPAVMPQLHHTAYVIYTSGSTGFPKGVMITHLGMMNHINAKIDLLQTGANDVIAQTAVPTFDISVWQFFTALVTGARTAIFSKELVTDPEEFILEMHRQQVTVVEVVPSYLALLANYCGAKNNLFRSLKYLLVTGEELHTAIVKEWAALLPAVKLVNAYGPTEAADDVTHYVVDEKQVNGHQKIPIGKPVRNTRLYVLDRYMKTSACGVKGEIYVSGAGLAKAYLNNEGLSAQSFIPNPFGKGLYDRLYRTGDLGYWRPDGELVYAGRRDHQIKIRGNRVELGEIEQKLALHSGVREAVVAVYEKENDKYLYACYTGDAPLDEKVLTRHLSLFLPPYMVPARFLWLESFPLTSNGKINRKLLPVPEMVEREIIPAQDTAQEVMADIWARLLKTERALISIDDNFFMIGGHSLKAMELIGEIRERFHKHISLSDIFRLQTLQQICEFLIPSTAIRFDEIKPALPKEHYALSSAQKRLFVVDRFNYARTGYNLSGVVHAGRELDEEKAEQAFRELIMRHDILRTSFELVDQKPRQRIHANVDFHLEKYEAGSDPEVTAITNSFIKPYDLTKPPLVRAGLIRCIDNEYLLVYDMHHIVSDGISLNVIWNDFIALYNSNRLPPLPLQYKDYAEWQQQRLGSSLILKQEAYWLHRLRGELPVLELPADFSRPKQFTYAGDTCSITLDTRLTHALKQLCRRTGTTMYTLAMSILNVLLYKYTGAEDLLVGAALSGREHPALQNMVGIFVNTLVIRNAPSGSKPFELFLQEVNHSLQEAYDNMDYQFDDLVEKLNPERDTSRNPIVDICLSSQNFGHPQEGANDDHVTGRAYSINNYKAKLDLTVFLHETETNIVLMAEYYAAVFRKETIERLLQHFVNIAERVTSDPTVTLANINMLGAAETAQLLYGFNNRERRLAPGISFHGIVEEQVARTPDAIALVHAEKQLTFRELDDYANRIGNFLFAQPYLQKGDLVALLINDPVLQVAAILGVLKAGLAFVPIDNEFPEERIATILSDGNIQMVLCDDRSLAITNAMQEQLDHLSAFACLNIAEVQSTILKEDLPVISGKHQFGSESIDQQPSTPVPVNITGDDTAYVIYTSGSSGKPKGVVIAHKGIANSLIWRMHEVELDATDIVLQVFSYVFDGFLTSTFSPLITGATVVLLSRDESRELSLIRKSIMENRITHFICVPSFFELILDFITEEEAGSVRTVALAGEKIRKGLITKALNKWRHLKIVNEYGPTENSVSAASYKWVTEETSALIGRPVHNVKVYILDRDDQLCPVGVMGELCLSGPNLSKGYLHLPELTAKKFTPLPFNANQRMYRTGDLARWLPDGDLEFFYRADDQVKIRGYRVELGEIERVLNDVAGITEATLVYTKNPEDLHGSLVAYYTGDVDVNTIKEKLRSKLPEYFMPGHIMRLQSLPRLMSGKIDKKALPAPVVAAAAEIDAGNAIEDKIRNIWAEILYCDAAGIGADDNFFNIGGHSLVAIELIVKIKDAFGCSIELGDIFDHPTIREQARLIPEAQPEINLDIAPAPSGIYYPLSYAQKRIFIQHYLENAGISYNMPAFFELPAAIDKAGLEQLLLQLLQRHEILRTAFVMHNGAASQVVFEAPSSFELEYATVAGDPAAVFRNFIRPFDLDKPPLFRALLCEAHEQRRLAIDLHHIAADGVSVMILMKEFLQLYRGETLPPLRLTYKDYAFWQTAGAGQQLLSRQELYWVEKLRGYAPLNLPTDYTLQPQQSFATAAIPFVIDEKTSNAIRALCDRESVTPFMVLITCYSLALYYISGQAEFVVGIPVSGRNNPDLERMVGMFMNTLPLPVNIDNTETCDACLRKLKGEVIGAFNNQEYPLQLLAEKLQIRPDPYRNPLFDVMLTFNNFETRQAALNDISNGLFAQSTIAQEISVASKYYLSMECTDNGKTISGQAVYRTELFKPATIQNFVQKFLHILQALPLSTALPVQDILAEEKDEMGFNF